MVEGRFEGGQEPQSVSHEILGDLENASTRARVSSPLTSTPRLVLTPDEPVLDPTAAAPSSLGVSLGVVLITTDAGALEVSIVEVAAREASAMGAGASVVLGTTVDDVEACIAGAGVAET